MRSRLVPLLSLVAAASCNPVPTATDAPPASTIAIGAPTVGSNKSISIALGDTLRIAYQVSDVFGHSTGATPVFVSRDTRVVSVSTRGLLRGNGGGTTSVIAYVLTTGTTFVSDSINVSVNVICTAVAKAGLVVSVEDSLTGAKGPFSSVSYVAKDTSTFKDSTLIASVPAQVSGSLFLVGLVYEHPGKYDVTVRATGYKPWVKTGVVVLKDACHVIPVSLTARLVPQ